MNLEAIHFKNFSPFLPALLLLYDVTNKTSFDNIQVGYSVFDSLFDSCIPLSHLNISTHLFSFINMCTKRHAWRANLKGFILINLISVRQIVFIDPEAVDGSWPQVLSQKAQTSDTSSDTPL